MLLSELCLPLLTSWAKNFTVAKAQIPPSDREGPPAQMVSGGEGMLLRGPCSPKPGTVVWAAGSLTVGISAPGLIPLADHGREPDRERARVPAHCW